MLHRHIAPDQTVSVLVNRYRLSYHDHSGLLMSTIPMTNEITFKVIGDISTASACSAALVVLVDPYGKILLQLRDSDKDIPYPGYWSLFGGGLEGEETPAQAAVRELNEEIGIILDDRDLTPLIVTLSDDSKNARIYIFSLTTALTPGDIVLQEGSGFAFFTREQIAHLPVVPYVMRALNLLWRNTH
ncbi:7,8-dihydro-8-oxoguanine-triphosphatase [Dickeya dianthicola]|uniref:7,8-dihydro-8-oxoguanine-triphosphatase n=2 Tax=Dickeya dianthicola TaxID=204039 RepID=A0AAX1C1F7_9GAMM|nr:7,8-dihydro-8-oxoguanine-triphosphatase [Dickeya dianthicola]